MIRFFIIFLERIRGGRTRRQSSPVRHRVDYEYDIYDIGDDGEDKFDDFENGETTPASDSVSDDAVVFMIPDIASNISTGGDDDGGGRGRGRRQQRRVLLVGR